MSEFKPEEFMLEPTEDTFQNLRKDDLISLAKHLKIEVRSTLRKREIQKIIMEHLVSEKTFEQSALGKYQDAQTQNLTTVNNSQVNLTDQTSNDELERGRQWQREQEDRQWQREQEERKWQREKMEREREREEREFRLKQQELELKKLEIQAKADNPSGTSKSSVFDFTKHIRMVPPFQEREVDKYFLHFEKVAKNCGRCCSKAC